MNYDIGAIVNTEDNFNAMIESISNGKIKVSICENVG